MFIQASIVFNLIEEAALESLVHILGKIGRGDESAVERLHLLEDDVLNRVLNFVHSPFCSFLTFVDDSVCYVEQEDGRNRTLFHLCLVAVKLLLDVFLTFTNLATLDLRNVHLHDVAAGLPCQLQHGLSLAGSWGTVKQASESTAEPRVFHACPYFVILLGIKQLSKLIYL